ncbi:hypothetical protein F892_00006 [Acinetobacter vivianii]|uniref:Type III toxin-antitoxin system ToxN/AbiQ family toxin n=1 Tax=Acinetobacter vivianii TaxID=1776742 RepID=N9Q4G7_9GAMM|nr:type III toxin-antitoxin system ToxN/AbiQ family toxin [Acinetobacter vivianii]ENX24856.1 hypothetical protein F892_00006 [Acinetobacter vivianii]GGI62117.1 hypothetical protein GCM10011446_36120 [Acinetobacter vivianii]
MSKPLRFYTIKDDFINKMKSLDFKIQNNYGGTRPYVGVLMVINGLNYYAPLSSYKPKQDKINNITVFKLHEKGNPNNKLGVIHINNMFPVIEDQLIEITIDVTDKYGRLLQNQYEFILHYQEEIQAQALQLYNLVNKNKNSFIARLSCDFKLLESALYD